MRSQNRKKVKDKIIMKRILLILLSAVILLSTASCGKKSKEQIAKDVQKKMEQEIHSMVVDKNSGKYDKQFDEEYNHNTLIISYDPKCNYNELMDICAKYKFEILYEMENFSMITVMLDHAYTDEEMDSIIAELENYDIILGAMKDYIQHLN